MSAQAAACGSGDPVEALLTKLRLRDDVSDHEGDVLRAAIGEIVERSAGTTIVRAGTPLTESTLLLDGFIARYKDLSGGQRQIMQLHVPGDFVDLHGFVLKRLEHNIGALTKVRIALVPHAALARITEEEPHLSRMLWLSTLVDSAVQREHILSVGRRSAVQRIAHVMCELFVRLRVIGLTRENAFPLAITQLDLADMTGLTSVHVNRMLRELRHDGLLIFRGGEVVISDWEGLKQRAEFEDDYLFLERRPR